MIRDAAHWTRKSNVDESGFGYAFAFSQDIIRKLLIVEVSDRLTAKDAVNHPWLTSMGPELAENDLGRNLEQLRIFNATRKMRAAIKSVRKA